MLKAERECFAKHGFHFHEAAPSGKTAAPVKTSALPEKTAGIATAAPAWMMPKLPERLQRVARALIDGGGKMGSDDLNRIIKFDPSRIYHDYKSKRLKDWINKHIPKPTKSERGVYRWHADPERVSKFTQRRNVKHSK